jgi:hypothetical protein
MAKAKSKIPKDMPLTQLIQDFVDDVQWKDEISIDTEQKCSGLPFKYGNDDLSFQVYLEADEARSWLKIFFYNEMTIPEKRYAEACELVNAINQRIGLGRLSAISKGAFQFRQVVDLEGTGSPTTLVIKNLIGAAMDVFSTWSEELGAVIFTKMSAKEILAALDNGQPSDSSGVPDEL